LILANSEKADPRMTGMSASVWTFLALSGAILFWNSYPDSLRYRRAFIGLKIGGLLLLAAMLIIFRCITSNGHAGWLDMGYWEILGMIGWTYLNVCILYIPTRRWLWVQFAWLSGLTVLNILCCLHWVTWAYRAPFYLWPFKSGAFSSVIMAGLITSLIFLTDAFATNRTRKTMAALCFAAGLFALGWLTIPLGISKVRATPTWCLVCSGTAICVFLVLYWVCDVQKHVRWANFVRPAGSNTLLTYLLPPLCAAALGRQALLPRWDYGWFAVAQALVFTAGIMALAALLTRCRVRVQL
jgi:hypothetical protein